MTALAERLLAAPFASRMDERTCRHLIRGGSRSFYVASLLLPPVMRAGAYALYGFCRLSDDAVDDGGSTQATVDRLRRRLDRIYAGTPEDNPADRCLADTAARHGIPRGMFDALMEGLQWDLDGRRYQTLDDVEAYAERVAASVGGMMAALMGARSPEMVERACDLGVAMQLTNIARDVGEDARNGRLYLPEVWMVEAGLDPEAFLANPVFSPALAGVVARLLDRADDLYARADEAIARLPLAYRPAIFAARLIYAEIGAMVARNGYDSINSRARTSASRKVSLVSAALGRAFEPVPEAALGIERPDRILVRLVSEHPTPPAQRKRSVQDDVDWLLDMFTDLEQRDRARAQPEAVSRRLEA